MSNQSMLHIIFLQRSNRFLMLLMSLIFFFGLYPIVENYFIATLILNMFFMLIVLSGVLAISENRKPLVLSLSLAVVAIACRWLHFFYTHEIWLVLEYCSAIVLWSYIAIHILKFIIQQEIITAELIYAALAVYFIFGLAWASAYQLIETSTPGSFSIPTPDTFKQNFMFQMWYFSMVTLTTLGFGDIAPVTMTARVFVVMEAIMGQFYLAVLIANLVGRRIAQKKP